MSMTVDQIVAEVRQLPREQREEILDRLNMELHGGFDPEVEAAWSQEALRRLQEIESGKVQLIPGEEVFARARKLLGR
jgi:putative addiction module component (TIGR02574 family)